MRRIVSIVLVLFAPAAWGQQSLDAHLRYIDAAVSATRAAGAPWSSLDTLANRYLKLAPTPSSYLRGVARLAYTWTLDPDSSGDVIAHTLSAMCSTRPEIKAYVIKKLDGDALEPSRRVAYARALRATEPTLYVKYMNDAVARYPADPIAMRAVSELAEVAATHEEKRALLERIHTQFSRYAAHDSVALNLDHRNRPEALYNRSMHDLFSLYLETEDPRGAEVASEMSHASPTDGDWLTIWYLERTMSPTPPLYYEEFVNQIRTLVALSDAKQTNSDHHGDAYATLVQLVAVHPIEPLASALYRLGDSLRKSHAEVDNDVWRFQQWNGKPFHDFTLSTFDGKRVSLADLRGKTVLVSFWFPTCQGCVEEFVNFQKIAERYKAQHAPFVLLAVNVVPEQDSLVRPLFDRMGLAFTPLKAPDADWEPTNYGVGGGPHNYILDATGRTIYQHFYAFDPDGLATAERQIDWVLSKSVSPPDTSRQRAAPSRSGAR